MAATGAVKMELRWLRMVGGRVVSSASSASSASAAVLRVLRVLRVFFNDGFSEWVR